MSDLDVIEDFPLTDNRSFGFHAAKLGVGLSDILFPGLGYLAQLGVDKLAGDPLQERRVKWLVSIGKGLRELQERFNNFDPASLGENEEFLSAVYEATEASMKTHKAFKLEALKNTVLNAAINFTIEDALRGRFMACIDAYTEKHVRVLTVLDDPSRFATCVERSKMFMGPQEDVIRQEIKVSEINGAVFNIVLKDLERDGFADTAAMRGMLSGTQLLTRRTTDIGRAFLRFIQEPTEF